ncbi:MAG: putative porin [Saprospiraceae bacterium]
MKISIFNKTTSLYKIKHHLASASWCYQWTILFKYRSFLCAAFVLFIFQANLFAQGPPSNLGDFTRGSGQGGGGGNTQQGEVEVDTFGVFYRYATNPSEVIAYADTTLEQLQIYNPTRQRLLDYANLGNLGSAHQPLFYETPFRRGLAIGLDQYSLYQMRSTDIRYYTLEKAYTDAFYSQGAEQSDSYLRLRFSRNFGETSNFSLQFQRISQLGSTNQYPYQNGRNTAFGVGYWYHSKNDRYNGFFSFTSNLGEHEDNGGIAEEPAGEGDLNSPTTATIFLTAEQAKTRQAQREFSYTHYYKLLGNADSVQINRRAVTLSHRILYRDSEYKAYDLSPNAAYYGELLTYDQGLRHFIQARTLQNEVKISTYKLQDGNSKTTTQRDLIEIGLNYDINNLNQEPIDTSVNNLFLTGRVNFSPTTNLRLNTYAHLGLLDNAGDFRLQGLFLWKLEKLGTLELEFVNQAYSPTLVETRAFISQRALWNNDFNKTIATTLSAAYTIPKLNTRLSARYHLVDNYIYFDSLATPQQNTGVINVLQLVAQQDIRLGILNLDNTVILQETTGDFIRAPRIFSKHSLYLAGQLFRKVLQMQIGFDLRINTPFFANSYLPLTGQFYLQDQQEAQTYPMVDFFFNAKIDRVRAFIKAENLTDLLSSNYYYQTAYHPQPVFTVRFGIFWRFIN